MTKQEFLTQLQRDLNGSIGSCKTAVFVEYYQEYIEIKLRKGYSMEDVMNELGNPRLIAHSIVDAHENTNNRNRKNESFWKYGKRLKDECSRLCRDMIGKARKWFEHL